MISGNPVCIWLSLIVCLCIGVASCAVFKPRITRTPGLGKALEWQQMEGWRQDNHAEAWPALLRNCQAMASRWNWKNLCAAAQNHPPPNDHTARQFFERRFTPHQLHGRAGQTQGLITGYYEPLLFGSFTPDDRYRYPLYAPPKTMKESGALIVLLPKIAN